MEREHREKITASQTTSRESKCVRILLSVDVNKRRCTCTRSPGKNEGWPSGGAAALPNLSLFPVSQRNDHTDADVGAHAAAAAGTSAAGAAGAASHLAESTGGGDVVGGGIGTGGSTPTTSSDKFPGGSCTG